MPGRSARGYGTTLASLLALQLVCSWARASEVLGGAEASFAACDDARLVIDPGIAQRFRVAATHTCQELKVMEDVDAGVRLTIQASGDGVLVRARLGDGRTATRRVSR